MEFDDILFLVMSLLFLWTGIQKYEKNQAEHFFIRIMISFCLGVSVLDLFPEQIAQHVTYILLIIMLLSEAGSPYLLRYWRNKK
jgi:uncharacterized membrane protein